MEYAKEDLFNIRYNTKINRVKIQKESWTSSFIKKIKRHKLATTVVLTFFTFSIINVVMIWNFMRICYYYL